MNIHFRNVPRRVGVAPRREAAFQPLWDAESGDGQPLDVEAFVRAINGEPEPISPRELAAFVRAINGEPEPVDPCSLAAFVAAITGRPDPEQQREFEEFVGLVTGVSEEDWDPGKHPRQGGPPNAGWFAAKDGGGPGGTGADGTPNHAARGTEKQAGPANVTPDMLEMAHAWWLTKGQLERYQRDLDTLPARIADLRARLRHDGIEHINWHYLAKADRDLRIAQAYVPQLEKQLHELEQQYHDSGFDDVPYSTWTPGETIVGGRGIEKVGFAVGLSGKPAGVTPTGDEMTVMSAPLGAPTWHCAAGRAAGKFFGKAPLGVKVQVPKAASLLPKGFDPAKGFSTFKDFKDAFGAAGPGQAWHHIVEQTINSGKFAAEILQNPANLLKLPHGKGAIHMKISGFYSSRPRFAGGLTVRQWLSKKTFKEQFEFGIKTIKRFGGTKYLPPDLR